MNPPASAGDTETHVQPPGWEDPLTTGMATCSSILAWRIPRTEEPGEPQHVGLRRAGHDWAANPSLQIERGTQTESKGLGNLWIFCFPSAYKSCIYTLQQSIRTSQVAQMVKSLPTIWETWVRSLGWEDPLEKEMATHSSILAWRTSWMGSLVGFTPWGRRVGHD